MHVLIAGCGWLGQDVARRLLARGDRVTGLTRTEGSAAKARAIGIEASAFDLAAPGASGSLTGTYDAIVAAQSASGRDEAAYRRAYVDATRALVESECARGVPFVYVGSTGIFDAGNGSWVDETTPPRPVDGTSRVLLEAESLVLDVAAHAALGRVVRCSGLYGPGRTGTIDRVTTGLLALGDGDDTWMNFCHRDDAANLVIAALDRGRAGAIYHASDASPATRRDVVVWIAARAGVTPVRRASVDAVARPRNANRRVSGEASRRELGVRLLYPTFRDGFAELMR
jgi:nucleoside-diphosphate-sugar epimerase